MVAQKSPKVPATDTFNDLTPAQAERAAKFYAMLTPQAAPRCKSYEELAAERAERRARSKAHYRPKKAAPPEAWMVTAEDIEAAQAQVRPLTRVKAQPVPELAELLDLEQFRPQRGRGAGTAGAGGLAELLHELARYYLSHRPYLYSPDGSPPRQVVLHLPAEMLAEALEVSDNTIREWAAQLAEVGHVQSRAHLTSMTTRDGEQMTAADGTLYAVRLAPGHTARLRYADYKRVYRDLDADRKAGRTAHNAIRWAKQRAEMRAEAEAVQHAEKNTSESFITQEGSAARAEILTQLRQWAVIPGNITSKNPLDTDSEVFGADELNTVQDVVYLLPTLAAAHRSKRAALVGMMAATIAQDLNDQHSRRYWCKTIWQAWQAELEGRDGLQHLAAQLQRLAVDIAEWKAMKNPAAVFAARMRAA